MLGARDLCKHPIFTPTLTNKCRLAGFEFHNIPTSPMKLSQESIFIIDFNSELKGVKRVLSASTQKNVNKWFAIVELKRWQPSSAVCQLGLHKNWTQQRSASRNSYLAFENKCCIISFPLRVIHKNYELSSNDVDCMLVQRAEESDTRQGLNLCMSNFKTKKLSDSLLHFLL